MKSGDNHVVMNMTKFLEYIRSEKENECKGDKMDIIKLLEFSGETPDGDNHEQSSWCPLNFVQSGGRPWYGSDD